MTLVSKHPQPIPDLAKSDPNARPPRIDKGAVQLTDRDICALRFIGE